MILPVTPSRRRAATLAESAFVYSTVFILTLGLILAALGVFTYQQVAAVAREGARWASLHGALYHRDTGKAVATPSNVWTNAMLPMAVGLDPNKFSPQPTVVWTDPGKMPTYDDANGNSLQNKVTVTVTYNWNPPVYIGAITLTSKAVMNVQY